MGIGVHRNEEFPHFYNKRERFNKPSPMGKGDRCAVDEVSHKGISKASLSVRLQKFKNKEIKSKVKICFAASPCSYCLCDTSSTTSWSPFPIGEGLFLRSLSGRNIDFLNSL